MRRFKQLVRDCDGWDLATRLRAFAEAAERRAPETGGGEEGLAAWVVWVRQHADALSAYLTREPPASWAFPRERHGCERRGGR